jgi:hypothetical protein
MKLISFSLFMISAVASGLPEFAYAGACGEEVAKLQTFVKETKDSAFEGATESQTVGAQLHHQPTAASLARAENEANGQVENTLKEAKARDADGNETECMTLMTKARMLLGLE